VRRVRRRLRRDEAQSRGRPQHVGIDREGGSAEGERENHRRGLWSHARKREQVFADLGVGRPAHPRQVVGAADLPEDREDPGRLDVGEPTGPDGDCQGGCTRPGDPVPCRVTGTQGFERSEGVHVARVLRQHGQDELVERIRSPRRIERAESPHEPPVDRPDPTPSDGRRAVGGHPLRDGATPRSRRH
jgi:hypothetical protein